jgi:biopolymer transport protein ExbD
MQLPLEVARRRSAISLTALIDVVFILLLFFMLASQFVRWQSLDLPLAQNAPVRTETLPLILTVGADGQLRNGDAAVTLDASCAAQTAAWLADSERPLIVRPHGDAAVQQILAALDCLRAAGATRLTLADALPSTES